MPNVYHIGIDFGSYYTKVAYYLSRGSSDKSELSNIKPQTLGLEPISDRDGLIPTFIYGEDTIGQKAYEKIFSENDKIKRGFKTKIEESNGYDNTLKFLSILRKKIEEKLKNDNLITYKFSIPAGWKKIGKKVEIFKEIIEKSGYKINSQDETKIFLTEPYACAAFYLRKGTKTGKYFVIDAGAGTIDFAVVHIISDNGSIKIKEIEESLDSFEKAGDYIDILISEHFRTNNIYIAEELKKGMSMEFKSGKSEYYNKRYNYKIKKDEVNEILKEWKNEFDKFLSKYEEKFERGNIILAGGFSDFYLIEDRVKNILGNSLENKSYKNDKKLFASFGCVIESVGYLKTLELVNYSVKIPIYYSFADKVIKVKLNNTPLDFKIEQPGLIVIRIISPDEQAGLCSKRMSEISFETKEGKKHNLRIDLLTGFKIVVEDKSHRRQTDEINKRDFDYLEPQDFEILVDRDHIPKLRIIGKDNKIKTMTFKNLEDFRNIK